MIKNNNNNNIEHRENTRHFLPKEPDGQNKKQKKEENKSHATTLHAINARPNNNKLSSFFKTRKQDSAVNATLQQKRVQLLGWSHGEGKKVNIPLWKTCRSNIINNNKDKKK